MKNISKLLLGKGYSFYNKGKILIKILGISVAAFVLIILVALIGFGGLGGVLYFDSEYGFANVLIAISYLGILVGLIGIPFYFIGLHYLGLGQISKNTDNLSRQEIPKDELPEL